MPFKDPDITPERVNKLPEWAKRERDRFIRRERELEAEVAALRAEPGALDRSPFDIHVAVLDPYRAKVPVGEGHVEYTFPDEPGDRRRSKRLSVRFIPATKSERAHVDINAAEGALHVKPRASNSIYLELHDD